MNTFVQKRLKIYNGYRQRPENSITVCDGRRGIVRELPMCGDIIPVGGYDWCFPGPQALLTSRSILADYFGSPISANIIGWRFMHSVIITLPKDEWELRPADIEAFLASTGIPGLDRITARVVMESIKKFGDKV